jgi:hypothetical protein
MNTQSKIKTYQELIAVCEMRKFTLEQELYEYSANSILNSVFEDRVNTYKAIINRLSQRIIKLKSNDK